MRRDLLVTAIGIGGGQAIVLLATPFLARIYSPEQFGVYAALAAVAGVLATIASLRFDVSIPALDSRDVSALLPVSLALPLVVVPVALQGLAGLADVWEPAESFIGNVPMLAIAGVAIFQGLTAVAAAHCTRSGAFRDFAALRLVQPAGFALIAAASLVGLNGALVASWGLAAMLGLYGLRKAVSFVSLRDSVQAVRRQWKYPLVSAPMALLDTLSLALPVFFIISAFGKDAAGNYSQVQRLIGAPIVLAGLAIAQVFYKHAGDLYRQRGNVERLLWRVVSGLAALALSLMLFVLVAGEWVLGLLLGAGWRIDTVFIALSVAPVVFRMVASPVSSVFLLTNRIELGGFWQVLYFSATVAVLAASLQWLDFEGFLVLLAISEFLMYSLYLGLAIYVVRKKP